MEGSGITVIGGGPAGAALASACARAGIAVALVERASARPVPDGVFDNRVYALNARSRRLLEEVGAWSRLHRERVEPVRAMRIFGDDRASAIDFSAYRSGVAELACIVEESNLRQALDSAIAGLPVRRIEGEFRAAEYGSRGATVTLRDGSAVESSLVVAADGARSAVREQAGIQARIHEYGQIGVVANFACGRRHDGTAVQWFGPHGILALLPLPGQRMSMVWSAPEARARELLEMNGEDLCRAVGEVSCGAAGGLHLEGAVAGFPLRRMRVGRLVASRLALIGDAAHNVHPLSGQGLNLGFGDVRCLADLLADRGPERDCGAPGLLRRYEIARREDLLAMELVTDGLQNLYGSTLPGAAVLRNLGLRISNHLPALKQILVERALA